ncbi:MAG: NRDE family protein, partial [Pyrinomonadaceae bacterium]
AYNGFNLLVGDADVLHYYSNRGDAPRAVDPGVHGVSNHLLDTPWPKVERGKRALAGLIAGGGPVEVEALFEILADDARALDDNLPATGVGLEAERMLSPVFIVSPTYGTRSSTVVLVGADDRVTFVERAYDPRPRSWAEADFQFRLGAD